jgi:microcystin-dependent protein
MAVVEHVDIPDTQLHEPKGIESAAEGTVYIADGSGAGEWGIIESLSVTSAYPIGAIVDYTGSTAPAGWEFCYGQGLQRAAYLSLFSLIGTTYGSGDGSTTFNLPDCRGRLSVGQDDMGGSSANRLTTPLNGDTLGAVGGTETVTITDANIPTLTGTTNTTGAHTHSMSNATNVIRDSGSGENPGQSVGSTRWQPATITLGSGGAHTHTVVVNDNNVATAHNNVMPTFICNKIIYHGVF